MRGYKVQLLQNNHDRRPGTRDHCMYSLQATQLQYTHGGACIPEKFDSIIKIIYKELSSKKELKEIHETTPCYKINES